MNLIIIFHGKKLKGWSWDYNFCFGGKSKSTKVTIRFVLYFYTSTPWCDLTRCSWHGELIKMMFSLRGALRFFAFLWLFNLLFAMLVIAFTHSFPIFCNGSSYSLTHIHTQRSVPLLHMEFLHFYGFILSLKPFSFFFRMLTNDWKLPSPSAKKKKKNEKRDDEC